MRQGFRRDSMERVGVIYRINATKIMRGILLLAFAAVLRAQSHWPAQLETDIKAGSWGAAARVGAALIEEIDAGRMFTRFTDAAEEVRARRLYADALYRTGKLEDARRQRAIAEHPENSPGFVRRLANEKAEVLASRIDQPSLLPRANGRATIVSFWASWCALCKPELDALANYIDPRAEVVKVDVDNLDPALRPYVPGELPQLYIVDSEGRIRFHIAGF